MPSKFNPRNLPVAIALAILVLAGAAFLIWRQFFDAYHFAVVQPGVLYRDGVRDMRTFQIAMRKAPIKTIVSLVDADEQQKEPFLAEKAWCQTHGVTLVQVPVTLGGWPDSGQIKEFLSIVNDPARQPVMVHCAQGVRRTGMMVAAYEISIQGLSADQAKQKIQTFGHSQRTAADVEKFIDAYDPKAEMMTAHFARNDE
jgi:protein tyrosine phosphatase (PTP) superfamily phosphohydrolase (DUF442 family)